MTKKFAISIPYSYLPKKKKKLTSNEVIQLSILYYVKIISHITFIYSFIIFSLSSQQFLTMIVHQFMMVLVTKTN